MGEFRMPSLGADMEAGTILEWRVQPGSTVHRGDIIAVVDTEKSTIEVEVFEDGVVEELLIATGVEVPVGTVLALIAPLERSGVPAAPRAEAAAESARPEAAPAEPPAPETPRKRTTRRRPQPAPAAAHRGASFVRASPRARRTAAERGVDLAAICGTGPGGAVVSSDLTTTEAPTVPSPATSPGPVHPTAPAPTADRHASMRHAIGALMERSKREIPHYYVASTIELHRSLDWLAERNAGRSIDERILPAALLLKATALAATAVPMMNGTWHDGFVPADAVHLGVAVSLRGGGLVAPAIHDAERLPLDELMSRLRDLVQRARGGRLRSSEMADPTLTVTNLGDQGVEDVLGVIYPPQVALVGFGRIVERPWAVDGLLGVRPVVRATLAADHRASDGHDGARFLTTLDHLLQTPEDL